MVRRILYGYRDDLKLSERWWHRLFFVISIFAVILLGGIAFVLDSDRETVAARTEEEKDNYFAFVKRNATANVPIFLISTFLEGPAQTGRCATPQDRDHYLSAYSPGVDRSF